MNESTPPGGLAEVEQEIAQRRQDVYAQACFIADLHATPPSKRATSMNDAIANLAARVARVRQAYDDLAILKEESL